MSYFTNQSEETNTQSNPSDQTNQVDYVAKIVQEKGSQWSDPQTIAKGYASAQEYIKQLEQQAVEMREDLGKQDYASKLLEELKKNSQPPAKESTSMAQNNSGNESQNTTVGFDEDTLKKLVTETLTAREKEQTVRQNLEQTDRQLTELFGTNVQAEVDQRAKALGMTKENLMNIASQSPSAFFKLLGEEVKKDTAPVVKGSINTAAGVFNDSSRERNARYYSWLRAKDKSLYYTPKVQQQMLEDRKRLGDKFNL